MNARPDNNAAGHGHGHDLEQAWQNIAGLRLRLRNSVKFYRHVYRGQPWLVIEERKQENYFRSSANVEALLHLLDGTRTVEQAWQQVQAGHDGLTREDVIVLIANLKANALLEEGASAADTPSASAPRAGVNSLLRPFSIRFALFDPDRLLDKTLCYVQPLFSSYAWACWLLLILTALSITWLHWPELVDHGEARFADPRNLLWYWLLYPLIKTLHEFGHAYATKRWGGNVREMGIMLLVFFPVPYVDSSTAHRFASKKHRMLVSAAGILVETFIASLALILWVNVEPGLVRDLAFDVVIIGGLATLLFNANPLLRFDGYYLLCELLEMPNLGTRASQYLGYLFRTYAIGMQQVRSPVTARGEIKWLLSYGMLAAIYRVFITLFIAMWVAGMLFIVGVLLALWAIIAQIVLPVIKWFISMLPAVHRAGRLGRFALVMTGCATMLLIVLAVPMGHSTYAEGIIRLPENAYLRAGVDGIVTSVLRADGEHVNGGERILRLENMELEARMAVLRAQLEQAEARHKDLLLQDRTQADIINARLAVLRADVEDVQSQLDQLELGSATRGRLSLPLASDLPGRYVRKGEVIGHVAELSQVNAHVVVPQLNIDAVRRDTRAIEVRLASRPAETIAAQYIRELPQATDQLPSRLLGTTAGGEVAVDARDESGVQAISRIFQVEIALPLRDDGQYMGQRVYVRFIHQRASLAEQIVHFLTHFMLREPFVQTLS